MSSEQFPSEGGITPERRFKLRSRIWREARFPSSAGMSPASSFFERLSLVRETRSDSEGDIFPESRHPARDSSVTALPAHVTPVQEHSGVDSFQFCRAPSALRISFLKERSAASSVDESAESIGRKKKKMENRGRAMLRWQTWAFFQGPAFGWI